MAVRLNEHRRAPEGDCSPSGGYSTVYLNSVQETAPLIYAKKDFHVLLLKLTCRKRKRPLSQHQDHRFFPFHFPIFVSKKEAL